MKFPLGQIVATPGVIRALTPTDSQTPELANLVAQTVIADALSRHVAGDWGNVCAEDAAANDQSVVEGSRVLSSYEWKGTKFWIITEADRSSTCVLLPDEY